MTSAHLIAILYLSATPTTAYQAPVGARALRSRVAAPPRLSAATAVIPDTVPTELLSAAVIRRPKTGGYPSKRKWIPALAVSSALCYAITLLLATLSGPVAQATKLIFAGAVAGVISRSACAPLEMVSTVMMCRGSAAGGMWEELSSAFEKEGWAGLFKGNGANCLKVAPSRGMQFLVYEFVKRQMVLVGLFTAAGAPLGAGPRLLAGGIAGMAAAALVYPLETVKTVMTVFPEECTSIPQVMRMVMNRAGSVAGLYAGLFPTLVAMFPYVGVEFMVYETLRNHAAATLGPPGTLSLLAFGAIGGAAGQAIAHPLDVVRRRMQMQGMGKGDAAQKKIGNLFSGLYTIGRDEGVPVLFKGLGPACLEKAPSTAIGYFIYEAMKTMMKVASV